MFWCGLIGFILFRTLSTFYTCISVSFFRFAKCSAVISSNTFLILFFLSHLGPLSCIGWHALNDSTDLICCFHCLLPFVFLSVVLNGVIFIILSSRSLICSSALFSLLSVLFFCQQLSCLTDCFLFIVSSSLLQWPAFLLKILIHSAFLLLFFNSGSSILKRSVSLIIFRGFCLFFLLWLVLLLLHFTYTSVTLQI